MLRSCDLRLSSGLSLVPEGCNFGDQLNTFQSLTYTLLALALMQSCARPPRGTVLIGKVSSSSAASLTEGPWLRVRFENVVFSSSDVN